MQRRPEPIDQQQGLGEQRFSVVGRQPVWRMAFDGQERRGRFARDGEQHIHGRRIKFGQLRAVRDLCPEHPVAEILDQQKSLIEIEGVDCGRG
jgi:hypothetical protein